ncbi:hypothetical protein KEM52_004362, partial [Ascosphaera acerosa]
MGILQQSTQTSPSGPIPANGLDTSPTSSRKRGFDGGDPMDVDSSRSRGSDRPLKAPRGPRAMQMRGGYGGPGGFGPAGRRGSGSKFPPANGGPGAFAPVTPGQMPSLAPTGLPPLNPNDPMSAMLALQAMGFPANMPALPGMPPAAPPVKIAEPCRDYENQGFCILGSACAYQHGTDPVVAQTEE